MVALRSLVEAGFSIAAVVTKPDSKKGRGQKLSAPDVKTYAIEHNIPVWQPVKLVEITQYINKLNQPTGVLVSYGKIIPQSIIDLFSPGIINLHPSLLPHYRGPSPIESAILYGDAITGISLMQLSAAMDAGPVYDQQPITVKSNETAAALYDTLGRLGSQRLVELLPKIIDGSLHPTAQDDTAASYSKLLAKHDGVLSPDKMTAVEAERRVRAFTIFPKTRLVIGANSLIILAAHVADIPATSLDQQFQDGKYLVIDKLVAPSGKMMNATAFLRGHGPQN